MRKRGVLFLNGPIYCHDSLQAELAGDELYVCADGGAIHAHTLGITPAAIIGDFDSLPESLLEEYRTNPEIELLQYPTDKDETDLELSLAFMGERGVRELLVIGALGGRFDQTLMNIFTLAQPQYAFSRCVFFDGKTRVTTLVGAGEATLFRRYGKLFSLIAVTSEVQGVTLQGARWGLTGETLRRGEGRGVSNEIISEEVNVSFQDGILLAIQEVHQ